VDFGFIKIRRLCKDLVFFIYHLAPAPMAGV